MSIYKTIVDHSVTPPISYGALSGECVAIRGMSVPVDNPPKELGIYPDGGADAIPGGMQCAGWTREIRDGRSVQVPTLVEIPAEPSVEDKLAAEAARILSDPDHGQDATEAVQGVANAVKRVAALGVDITDWSFEGVTAAAQLASGKVEDIAAKFDILQASLALRVAWDRWEYHAGSKVLANHLWGAAYSLVFPEA